MSIEFYIENSYSISELITRKYSTSFSLATSLLEKDKRRAIYAIYGFVRLADEIVDSFHGYDKAHLLYKLENDLNYALENGISTNTLLVAFADTVRKYDIKKELIDAFLESMKRDLTKSEYNNYEDFNTYIYGSADVVGLMCLRVFCNENAALYDQLKYPAQRLGSAFQKVNFIRDLKEDITRLGRSYFPEISNARFDIETKRMIEQSIDNDFNEAWVGIKQLPGRSKLAVALAYFYFFGLLKKIKKSNPDKILNERVRISNFKKYLIITKAGFLYKLNMI